MKELIKALWKGGVVGGTMMVPGVSGGSMAMLLGVYDKLITSVSSFRKHWKKSLIFLLCFSVGGGIGMLLLAKPLSQLIELYPKPTLFFFLGAVAGGIPMMVKKAGVTSFSWKVPLWVLGGIALVLGLSFLPADAVSSTMDASFGGMLLLFAAGIFAAVALVLPGISVSYLFLVLGLYDEIMKAIGDFYLPFLLPLGLGLIIGIFLTTKVLESLMIHHPKPTYLVILGFLLGSVYELFPGFPTGGELFICLLLLFAGFSLIWLLSRFDEEGGKPPLPPTEGGKPPLPPTER